MLVHDFIAVSREESLNKITYDMFKKDNCVKIHYDIILQYHNDFLKKCKTHWENIGNINEGLNYYGITIILNEDIPQFVNILSKYVKYTSIIELIHLCNDAILQGKDIVHYGI